MPVLAPAMEEIAAALEVNGLPLGGSEAVVGIAQTLGRIAAREGQTGEVEFCETILREVALDGAPILADQPSFPVAS